MGEEAERITQWRMNARLEVNNEKLLGKDNLDVADRNDDHRLRGDICTGGR